MFDPEDGVFGPMTTVYASFDGGRTWSHVLTDSTADTEDPACVFGPNGTAYFGHIQPMRIYRSTDAGKTWSAATFPVGPDQEDRDFLSVDNTGGKFHGRVYAYAQMAAPHLDGKVLPKGITLWRSLDSGKSFEGPVQRFPDDFSTAFHPGNSAVLSDGTWMAVVNQLNISKRHDGIGGARLGPPSEPNGSIKVITSTDGGQTLNDATTVSDAYADWRQVTTLPVMAADVHSAAFKDRLYVAWTDGRFGERDQVVLSVSSDKGKTWSRPRIVNDDLRFRDAGDLERNVGLVSVAVNPNGVVGVIWEDRRNNTTDEVGYEIRFAASIDGVNPPGPLREIQFAAPSS